MEEGITIVKILIVLLFLYGFDDILNFNLILDIIFQFIMKT